MQMFRILNLCNLSGISSIKNKHGGLEWPRQVKREGEPVQGLVAGDPTLVRAGAPLEWSGTWAYINTTACNE